MINLQQIRDLVVIPALSKLGPAEPAAVRLVIGTGLIESNYEWLAQDGGPALGFFQMEPATAQDLWTNFLAYRPDIKSGLFDLMVDHTDFVEQIGWNLQYAAAMCRIKYMSIPAVLPDMGDLEGMAGYWLKYYNAGGKGDSGIFIERATTYGLMNL